MIWTDSKGRPWEIIDFKRPDLDPRAKAKRVALGHHSASGRSFTPHGWTGPTMLYDFGAIAYRDTEDRTLEAQLSRSYPVGSSQLVRMNPKGPDGESSGS